MGSRAQGHSHRWRSPGCSHRDDYARAVGDRSPATETVRLVIVANEGEAEAVCGLLRSEGIRCAHRTTDLSAERGLEFGGWREVLVSTTDEAPARELLAANQ